MKCHGAPHANRDSINALLLCLFERKHLSECTDIYPCFTRLFCKYTCAPLLLVLHFERFIHRRVCLDTRSNTVTAVICALIGLNENFFAYIL